jgi:hypothetical protein
MPGQVVPGQVGPVPPPKGTVPVAGLQQTYSKAAAKLSPAAKKSTPSAKQAALLKEVMATGELKKDKKGKGGGGGKAKSSGKSGDKKADLATQKKAKAEQAAISKKIKDQATAIAAYKRQVAQAEANAIAMDARATAKYNAAYVDTFGKYSNIMRKYVPT